MKVAIFKLKRYAAFTQQSLDLSNKQHVVLYFVAEYEGAFYIGDMFSIWRWTVLCLSPVGIFLPGFSIRKASERADTAHDNWWRPSIYGSSHQFLSRNIRSCCQWSSRYSPLRVNQYTHSSLREDKSLLPSQRWIFCSLQKTSKSLLSLEKTLPGWLIWL